MVQCSPLTSVGSSAFVLSSYGLPPSLIGGAQQISLGKTSEHHDHPVASTPATPTDIGLHRCSPTHPPRMPYGASLSFVMVTHLWLPPDGPSRTGRGCPYDPGPVIRTSALASSVSYSLRHGHGSGLSPPVCWPCHPHLLSPPSEGYVAKNSSNGEPHVDLNIFDSAIQATKQMRRSATSVPLNIAEGSYSRGKNQNENRYSFGVKLGSRCSDI